MGRALWQQLTHAVLLTEQNRVIDKQYEEILNRVSMGKCTVNDYEILNTRLIDKIDMTNEKFINAPFIVPGNELRREINKLHASWNAKKNGQVIQLSIAKDSCSKIPLTDSKKKQLSNLPYTKSGNLPTQLELFVGLPIMVTKNLAVELGICNGALGTITRIKYGQNNQIPCYVVAKFQCSSCPKLAGLENGEIPIFPTSASYQFKFPGTVRFVTIHRVQLPIVSAYSYTSYKSQGKTLSAIVTDLQPSSKFPIDSSFSYVPLSRVRSLNDLVILRKFPISVLQLPRSNDYIAHKKWLEGMDLNN